MIEIQTKLAERALELCNLDENKPAFILDVGCGSGLSCGVIENHGYSSIGIDISQPMINVGKSRGCDDVILADMGLGVPFRPATFDACISISALQWLCNSYASDQIPSARLLKFFTSLYACMKISSRTVFHFYPSDHQQIELINRSALKAGFTGGVLIDYPNSTRAKNYFLCLFVGIQMPAMPQPLTESESAQDCRSFGKKKHKLVKKSKAWINAKKESMAKKGIEYVIMHLKLFKINDHNSLDHYKHIMLNSG
ncbi:putative 18S rRNA (guanine-N(7))-methyltransferase [Thelohanellus kitauei]|uniref:Putative 18S rRNA (Guanine-N(7))-methyltransferase n=1 Tax=Thelohanellus kitauei TaxID=669202 RepID=A0A0C2N5J6_THEKT|nr:putative 18S rRNA (guanine-N(7))-methyltransferase [Thelohanellus kitauei]